MYKPPGDGNMQIPIKITYAGLPGCKVVFLGRQPRCAGANTNGHISAAYGAVNRLGAQPDKICQVIVPSDDTERGYQTIVQADHEDSVTAEGIILNDAASGAFLQTRDCPTLFLVNEKTDTSVMTHAGKFALLPTKGTNGGGKNIVDVAFQLICKNNEASSVHAYVVGGICPTCFQHNDVAGQAFIKPFLQTFGADIFVSHPDKGQLNLNELIYRQLLGYGVPKENITIDTTCPREHLGCSSYRGITQDGDDASLANTLHFVKC